MYSIFIAMILFSCGDKESVEDTSTSSDTATEQEADADTDTDTDTDSDTDSDTDTDSEADVANGQIIHDNLCMGCHENNPAMAQKVPTLSDAELEEVIQNGQGYMPPQDLSARQLMDVIGFLRQEYP